MNVKYPYSNVFAVMLDGHVICIWDSRESAERHAASMAHIASVWVLPMPVRCEGE